MDFAWPIISNKEAIAVNQQWAGESGHVFAHANTTVSLGRWTSGVPAWQYLSKALPGGRVAVLMVNHGNTSRQLVLQWSAVPGLACAHVSASASGDAGGGGGGGCAVRDIWGRRALGTFQGSFTAHVESHGSAFLTVM